MFELFTDRARKVMALAGDEARRLNHQYIGTEHVLLALVADDSGMSRDLLRMFDVGPHDVGLEVEKLVHRGPMPVRDHELPLTPRVQQVIEFAH